MSFEKWMALLCLLLMFAICIICVRHVAFQKKKGDGPNTVDILAIAISLIIGIWTAATQLPIPPVEPAFSFPNTQSMGKAIIELKSPSGTWIYYQLDGNGFPDRNSFKYEEPFPIYKTTVVSAIAIDILNSKSNIVSKIYNVNLSSSEFNLPIPNRVLEPSQNSETPPTEYTYTTACEPTTSPTPTYVYAIATGTPISKYVYATALDVPTSPTPKISLHNQESSNENVLVKGDLLVAVNCNEYVTLRDDPIASVQNKIDEIPRYETVTYISTEKSGFYKVVYKGKEGYALAAYLAPADSVVFKEALSVPSEDLYFEQNDMTVDGITIGLSNENDVEVLLDQPNSVRADGILGEIFDYKNYSITFSKSLIVKRIDIINPNVKGPLGINVGMHIAEALNNVNMNVTRTNEESDDLILYSEEQRRPAGAYAYIHNDREAGNGFILFHENKKGGNMVIEIKDSYVSKISVYIE